MQYAIEKSEVARMIHYGDAMEKEYLHYNYFADYALLAFLLDKEARKIIPGGEVNELRYRMKHSLMRMDSDTDYRNYSCYYLAQTDMVLYSGGNKYAPDNFVLKEGYSMLDVARRVANLFDQRQLSTVLPPEVVSLLISLLPAEEEKDKVYLKNDYFSK